MAAVLGSSAVLGTRLGQKREFSSRCLSRTLGAGAGGAPQGLLTNNDRKRERGGPHGGDTGDIWKPQGALVQGEENEEQQGGQRGVSQVGPDTRGQAVLLVLLDAHLTDHLGHHARLQLHFRLVGGGAGL